MKLQALFMAAAMGVSLQALQAADLTGKIILKGTPPAERPIPMDPACSKLHPDTKPTTRFYTVDANGGMADVFIYIKEGAAKSAAPSTPVILDQVNCEYVPYVAGAQTGQKIVVKNSDPVFHNVHPTPTVAGNKEYNKSQLPKGPDLEFSWDNPEVFLRFKCDVHPWMFSYVGLLDHPYYAVSGKDGSFKIANLPPGKYVVEAVPAPPSVRNKIGTLKQEVTIDKDTKDLVFTFEIKD